MVDRWSRVIFLCLVFFLLFGTTLEQQFSISLQDRFALLQLRSSLGLRAKEWPIKSDPCVNWVGIQCLNGRVTGINISSFRRTRRGSQNPQFSVDALQNLTFLSSFNASNFALPGSVPEWLGLQLGVLRVLDLRSCLVNGDIPFTLGNLSSLVELYLSDNRLTGIVPFSLGQLSSLTVLDLSRNLLTGSIPESFSSLGNLSLLDMSSNFLSGVVPSGIGNLSRLQFLNLSRNSLSSSIPAQLGDLSSLVDLDLGFNSLIGSVPSELQGLKILQRMVIGNNFLAGSLPDNLFPPLTNLQFVVLNHNNFSGNFPYVFWSMPELRFLDASSNNFTGTLPNVTSNASATFGIFNISHNMFYGSVTSVITRLSSIDMSGNYFQGRVPDYARGKASLRRNCLQNVTSQRGPGECSSFYAERGLVFDNFGLPNNTQSRPAKSEKQSHKTVIILAAVLGGVGVIVLLVVFIVLLIVCKRKNRSTNQGGTTTGPTPAGETRPPPGVSLNFSSLGDSFTYQQILEATAEFNEANLIKHGHSGDLFRGILEGGTPIVIKKIDQQSTVKKESYMLELDLFGKVSHPRLVPLIGHCLDNENEKFLVYKYMPNGDLSSSLFKKTESEDDSLQSLDWITRLKIAIGAAEGLSYLHHECTPPLVHRDVQASSIFLDDKYEVRLGSLSGVCPQEGDTHQSRFSKLLRLPQTSEQGTSGVPNATCAYDVYCFGKVLLELVTGKLGISSSTYATTKEWMEASLPYISIYDKELVTNIIDPSLIIDEDLLEEVWAMAIVARSCLNPKPTRRPLMRYILKALENPLKVVREENSGSSARLRATSSRGSWNAALFGSWRHGSDVAAMPAAASSKMEGPSSLKQSGTSGSHGSGQNGHSSSSRRHSKEIFPEPMDARDIERAHEE